MLANSNAGVLYEPVIHGIRISATPVNFCSILAQLTHSDIGIK